MKRQRTMTDILFLSVWVCAYAVIVRVFRMMRWFESGRGAQRDLKSSA